MLDLGKWVRPNILTLKPYSSARDEFKGEASVFLDANENPYNAPYNRYPDPLQWGLKKKIAEIKGVAPEQIFLGVGSDECIDVLFRAFCVPGRDNVVAIDPTYGMYKVCADINDVEYRPVRMNEDFDFDADTLLENVDDHTKLIFSVRPTIRRAIICRQRRLYKSCSVLPELWLSMRHISIFHRSLVSCRNFPRMTIWW